MYNVSRIFNLPPEITSEEAMIEFRGIMPLLSYWLLMATGWNGTRRNILLYGNLN